MYVSILALFCSFFKQSLSLLIFAIPNIINSLSFTFFCVYRMDWVCDRRVLKISSTRWTNWFEIKCLAAIQIEFFVLFLLHSSNFFFYLFYQRILCNFHCVWVCRCGSVYVEYENTFIFVRMGTCVWFDVSVSVAMHINSIFFSMRMNDLCEFRY